ncbi:hypothetical protein Dimus_011046 [Dionaea muscipula]
MEASRGALSSEQGWARRRDPRDLAIEGFPGVISGHWSLGRHGVSVWLFSSEGWPQVVVFVVGGRSAEVVWVAGRCVVSVWLMSNMGKPLSCCCSCAVVVLMRLLAAVDVLEAAGVSLVVPWWLMVARWWWSGGHKFEIVQFQT